MKTLNRDKIKYLSLFFWLLAATHSLVIAKPVKAQVSRMEDLPLLSVVQRQNAVLAINAVGLFSASLKNHVWKRLGTPASLPSGGDFASGTTSTSPVYYYVNHWQAGRADRKPGAVGLYVSLDEGRSWRLVTPTEYSLVYWQNGSLYAVENPHSNAQKLKVSLDGGETWRDITKSGFGNIIHIFPDPDHSGLVCVLSNSLRNYIHQASDARYDWQINQEWEWEKQHQKPDAVFDKIEHTGSFTLPLYATLHNYFQHDFGNRSEMSGINIVPDRKMYRFSLQGPKVVRASITLQAIAFTYPSPDAWPKLVDLHNQALWGLNIIGPDGKDKRVLPTAMLEISTNSDRSATQKRVAAEGGMFVFPLSVGMPYTRDIDLDKLFAFATPGTYRVQLDYDNAWLVTDSKHMWNGGFNGDIFTVVITP